jgi:hypothetical protein
LLDYEDEEAPPSPGGFGVAGTAEETGPRRKRTSLGKAAVFVQKD